MKLLVAVALLVMGIWTLASWAQSPTPPPPSKYQPTEVQSLRLQVAQKNAQLAQAALQSAQRAFADAFSALQQEAAKVKAEQKWDDAKVTFNPDTLTFVDAPTPAAPKPEVKKP